MSLLPDSREVIARAANELRLGLPLIVTDDGRSIITISAEAANDERLRRVMAYPGCALAVTARRAETLKARPYDGDLARLRPPRDVGPAWFRAAADPSRDLDHPLSGPHLAIRDDQAAPYRAAIRLARNARLLPAVIGAPIDDAQRRSRQDGLVSFDAANFDGPVQAPDFALASQARLPLLGVDDARIRVYRSSDGSADHCAIEIGQPDRRVPVLTRLHSQCFTGDVLGSRKCDCGAQLAAALDRLRAEGSGVLLYLEQEGRGIGIANKIRAYSLQDRGFDTVEANHRLGYEDDERDFRAAAMIIAAMGFSSVRLMTNNPLKIAMLETHGIKVADRVPLIAGRSEANACYLDTKARKSGHLL